MNNIQGKVVVITGASSGIGEITAKTLAKLGANVVLGARRLDRLENLVAAIEAEGGKAIAVKMDVTQREDVEHLIKSAVEHFGRVDVLINNAGVMLLSTMDKLRVDEWDKMIDINVKGVLYGIAAVLPVMKAQKSGQIINVSSVAGIKVFSGLGTVYSATKFAVKAISEGLRQEVSSEIRTTTIMPGAVATELASGSTDKDASAAVGEFYAANEISSDAVARAIVYAVEQPADVDINEIVIRPTRQDF